MGVDHPVALSDLARGAPVVLACPGIAEVVANAAQITSEHVALMAAEAGGVIRVALSPAACERLGLEPMGRVAAARHGEDWQVSVEARRGVTTGISAADRARTIRVLADPDSTREDLIQPGHVVPVRAHRPRAFRRLFAPDLALELCEMASVRSPAAALCHILDEDGELADAMAAEAFAERLGLHVADASELPSAKRVDIRGSLLFPG